MSAHVGAYYLRLMVVDRPGVIADVTAVLRDLGVSLELMLQRGRAPGEAVPVVLVTHETQESAMREALAADRGAGCGAGSADADPDRARVAMARWDWSSGSLIAEKRGPRATAKDRSVHVRLASRPTHVAPHKALSGESSSGIKWNRYVWHHMDLGEGKRQFAFIGDEALTRGAAIAFYTVTSIGPVLFIVVAIAGLAFGEDAARGAIAEQLGGLMGRQSADLLQTAIQNAATKTTGFLATAIGLITLIITASGVFTEMQSTLNIIWKAEPRGTTVTRLMRARAASLGLVAALGFLLLVSLVVSTLLSALSDYINAYLPFGHLVLQTLAFLISFGLISLLFGAIYKVLPDKNIEWHDVMIGAVVTALLFTIGKSLISLYIGSSTVASSYGAAGSLIVVLLMDILLSTDFPAGAEFTKVYASHHGSHKRENLLDKGP